MRRCEFVSKFLPQSQLVIIIFQLRWLHKTTDLGSSIKISLLLGRILRLLLYLVELRIVSREFLQRNEEVTKVKPEFVVLSVKGKKSLDEGSNLWSIDLLVETSFKVCTRSETYACRLVKAVCRRLPTKLPKKSRFDVPTVAWPS